MSDRTQRVLTGKRRRPELPLHLRGVLTRAGRTVTQALAHAWHDRVLGLAAEFGFWQLLSLPPLALAVLGILGYFGNDLTGGTLVRVENSLLDSLSRVIVPDAVDSLLRPALHDILTRGRADVVSVGFLVALWSGSSAMATFVNTTAIAYDRRHHRGAVRSRLVALRLYLVGVAVSVVLLPLLVVGPTRVVLLAGPGYHRLVGQLVTLLYAPVVYAGSVLLLAAAYRFAVPGRIAWRHCLPGALLAMGLWVAGSYGLRAYFEAVFRSISAYGPLASPVAVLLFLYVTALAMLLGAELNGQLLREAEGARLDGARQPRESGSAAGTAPLDQPPAAGTQVILGGGELVAAEPPRAQEARP